MLRRHWMAAGMLIAAATLPPATAEGSSGGVGGQVKHRHAAKRSPFAGNGMWIWELDRSSGGNYRRIARKARRHRIRTLYVKAADGRNIWSQFTPQLVRFMHGRGLRVCAWQYTYGTYPRREARRGAAVTKSAGADCFVIDAESEYEGHYASADSYVHALRSSLGRHFPIGLAGFPYVDYHPGYPYSVFMGPRGAKFNLPQVYWHTIGTTVTDAYLHTFTYNRVYRRPLMPIGQTYDSPPVREIQQFRRYAHSYGFDGLSWWDWQETTRRIWSALRVKAGRVQDFKRPASSYPVLARGSTGDLVIWAQEHLRAAGLKVNVNGRYRHRMVLAVRRFQQAHKLVVDGRITTTTWRALLSYSPDAVNWSKRARRGKAGSGEPWSARLPAVRDEIPPPEDRR